MITVEVGQAKKQFQVHEGLLRHHSAWFDNRLNGKWGDTTIVSLPEDEPAIFKLFVEFIYQNQLLPPVLPIKTSGGNAARSVKRQKIERGQHHDGLVLVQLYIFADMRQCPALACAAVDAFRYEFADMWKTPSIHEIQLLYKNTPAGRGMRRLIIDIFTKTTTDSSNWLTDPSYEEVFCTENHPEFMTELVLGLYKSRTTDVNLDKIGWGGLDACDYHDHDDDDETVDRPAKT